MHTDKFHTSPVFAKELLPRRVLLTGTEITNSNQMPQQVNKLKKGEMAAAHRKWYLYMVLAWRDNAEFSAQCISERSDNDKQEERR